MFNRYKFQPSKSKEELKAKVKESFQPKAESEQNINSTVFQSKGITENFASYAPINMQPEDKSKVKYIQQVVKKVETQMQNTIDKALDTANLNEHLFKIPYKDILNTEQYKVVTHIKGPLVVIAAAGSGKTYTLSHRVAYMIESGINPSNILLLTFTRKAAKEMVARTDKILNSQISKSIYGGTFHSIFYSFLRREKDMQNVTIIDEEDSEEIISFFKKELKMKELKTALIKKLVSSSINNLVPLEEAILDLELSDSEHKSYLDFGSRYIEYKQENKMLDFDDLLKVFYDKLASDEEFLNKMQSQFLYIMVDEYQDTNIIQKAILQLIADKHKNIMVVGDDSQSIYKFRSARVENILLFSEDYDNVQVVKIEQNYRSNQKILDFANSILKQNKLGYSKTLYSDKEVEHLPKVKRFPNEEREAHWIFNEIKSLTQQGINPSNIAILYRNIKAGDNIDAYLSMNRIPFKKYGGQKFFDKKHNKDVLALIGMFVNSSNSIHWQRILKYFEGMGSKSLTEVLNSIKDKKHLESDIFAKKKYYEELKSLEDLFTKVRSNFYKPADAVLEIVKFYQPYLKTIVDDQLRGSSPEDIKKDFTKRMKELEYFYNIANNFKDIAEMYNLIMLEPEEDKSADAIVLSTIHSAKGLEWEYVYVIGLLDKSLPGYAKTFEDLEESRRLFYVACTRAKHELTMTIPKEGKYYDPESRVSRFLTEIDKNLYEVI